MAADRSAQPVDVLAELRTMRTRFVNCAMHNGSDREFAEGASEGFDKAVAAVADLIAAADVLNTGIRLGLSTYAEDWGRLDAALARMEPQS